LNRSGQPRPELLMRHTPYSAKVQQRPLPAASDHDRQHTELAGTMNKRPAAPLVRDEEAAGSCKELRRLISAGFQGCMSIPG
jgi:hypothetical protein